jgi:hypothetical protein
MSQEKYIGMDVHQATISVAVMDAGGKLIMECLLETKAATIVEFIRGLHGTLSLTFEEGTSAISASTRPGPLRDFYVARVEKGMRSTMARLTLARKMAAISLTIWKKGVEFDANLCSDQQLEHL